MLKHFYQILVILLSPKVFNPINSNFYIRYKKHLILALLLASGSYLIYFFKYSSELDHPTSRPLLSQDYFTTFKITYKKDIDDDHFLLELSPKYKLSKYRQKYQNQYKELWNGHRIWSVEFKQPDIMIARKYTPLPILLSESNSLALDIPDLIKLQNDEEDPDSKKGKLFFYIKKYENGEVAKWLSSKPLGSEIEIRGPYTEFVFPFQPIDKYPSRFPLLDLPSKVNADPFSVKELKIPKPDNYAFYAGGTGITPFLQVLLSHNPPQGHVFLHYSTKTKNEVPEIFDRYLYYLEKLNRVTLKRYIDDEKNFIISKDINKPSLSNFTGRSLLNKVMKKEIYDSVESEEQSLGPQDIKIYSNALAQADYEKNTEKQNPSLSIVCGPDGYINYISGSKTVELEQGKVSGLLKQKGWSENNVFKL
ncbi:oxidoreductase ASCRUDRAFT_79837 [Ascoidea rubescens DSM 1968]|uniref:Flavoprotein pyridine nucleotide cytochrome reductase-like FAD-binding domain-containing protein n=1 Tax=Ascoidea rubescens DSM 1968 TaxID=1344418 RepID=A0A1D2VKZ0_9ASCO|nr:hypothetical protein ASCRUDRAFT_79837 [Ascoidea rubescens DSM 1968]ODV62276.1 hypothetical protein ASCRUDRAFT_79837 [Ascoidea rubescens DSM 1968]